MELERITRRLPNDPRKPALVSGVAIEREQNLDSSRSDGRIVILTDRILTRNGGNGHTGLDGVDMNNIRQAVRAALGEDRSSGFIKSFVVRERRHYPAGRNDKI